MKFGVIVCPKCRTAKGVSLSSKTTRCTRCNKVIHLDKVKILYKTNSEQKLRQAIGLINAEIDGNIASFKKLIASKKLY